MEEDFIHPCKAPLLNKPEVFLDVSEVLLYSVGECAVILSSRSEVEMCSWLLHRIWNSLLKHVAVSSYIDYNYKLLLYLLDLHSLSVCVVEY